MGLYTTTLGVTLLRMGQRYFAICPGCEINALRGKISKNKKNALALKPRLLILKVFRPPHTHSSVIIRRYFYKTSINRKKKNKRDLIKFTIILVEIVAMTRIVFSSVKPNSASLFKTYSGRSYAIEFQIYFK